MKKLSFLLICVASKKYGFGHLNRSISFSHYINKKHSSKIITFTNDTIQQKLNKCKPNLIKKFDKKLNDKDIEKYDFVIFDISNNLFLKNNKIIKHLEKISNRYSEKIIIIDGIKNEMINKNKKIRKKLLICPYLVEKNEIKKNNKDTKYLIGSKYFIPHPKMINLKKKVIKKNVRNVLVTCGGSDLEFYSIYLTKILLELDINIKINVIIGPFFNIKLVKLLKKISLKHINVKLIFYPKNIWQIMLKNDVVICSSGLTKYETILLGLPSIVFCSNKLQKKYNRGYEKKNISVNIDDIKQRNEVKKSVKNLIQSYDKRKKLLYKSNKIIDLNGANRILKVIKNLKN